MMREKRLRILFVDDQKEAIDLFKQAIEDEGGRAVLCTDADSAIDLFDEMEDKFLISFDLVVLDMLMPLPDSAPFGAIAGEHAVGAYLLRHLRSWNDHVRVIVFTQLKPVDVMEELWGVYRDREAELGRNVPEVVDFKERQDCLRRSFRVWLWEKAQYDPPAFAQSVKQLLSRKESEGHESTTA
jgi:CheY-like chemotaxis protein